MNVDLLDLVRVGGEHWRRLMANAISDRLRRATAAGDTAFEDATGSIEDGLLDSLCSIRALNAASRGYGDRQEALVEVGESLVRLMDRLAKVRCESVADAVPRE